MWKIKLQKIVRDLLDKLQKLYMKGTERNCHLEIFSRPQVIENSRQYWFAFPSRYFKPGCAQTIFQVTVLLIIIKTTKIKKRKQGFLAWMGEEISYFALSPLLLFNSINGEIKQFHVVVVQWRQRNEPKCVPHVKSCSFATDLLLLLFWTHLTKILLLQKYVLRYIFFANRNVHAIPLFIAVQISCQLAFSILSPYIT